MAAFALGLIGDAAAAPALITALADADPLIQGRAAEALGLIGAQGRGGADRRDDRGARQRRRARRHRRRTTWAIRRRRPSRRCASACMRWCGSGRTTRWRRVLDQPTAGRAAAGGRWPIAFQRVNDPRARPALLDLLQRRRAADPRVCGARPWRAEGSARRARRCWPRPRTRRSRSRCASRRCAALATLGEPAAAPRCGG